MSPQPLALVRIPPPVRLAVREFRADELTGGRAVLHRIHRNPDARARRERRWTPARARQRVRTAALDAPFLALVAVLDVELNPDVRVLPLELFHRPGDLLDPRAVEHRRRVMRGQRSGREQDDRSEEHTSELQSRL